MKLFTETDLMELKVQALHFDNICRGRVTTNKFFETGLDIAKMDAFVPVALTRWMLISKHASLYDELGKIEQQDGGFT